MVDARARTPAQIVEISNRTADAYGIPRRLLLAAACAEGSLRWDARRPVDPADDARYWPDVSGGVWQQTVRYDPAYTGGDAYPGPAEVERALAERQSARYGLAAGWSVAADGGLMGRRGPDLSYRPRVTTANRRTAFGIRLAQLRRQAGLRQIDVAVEIGAELSTYRKWEYGINEPQGVGTFARLAAVLGLSMDDLWHGALPPAEQPRDVPPRRDEHPGHDHPH